MKGYDGNAVVREMARVQFRIGEKVWNKDVALAESAELDGRGILAVNLGKSESWELLDLVRENKEFRVNMVETRAQRKERVQEEVADAIAMEREESGSMEVYLEEVSMDEEEEMNRSIELILADEQNFLGDDEEEREESLEVGVEENSGEIRNKGQYKEKIEIDVPFVKFGSDRESFAKEVREDPSLKAQREVGR